MGARSLVTGRRREGSSELGSVMTMLLLDRVGEGVSEPSSFTEVMSLVPAPRSVTVNRRLATRSCRWGVGRARVGMPGCTRFSRRCPSGPRHPQSAKAIGFRPAPERNCRGATVESMLPAMRWSFVVRHLGAYTQGRPAGCGPSVFLSVSQVAVSPLWDGSSVVPVGIAPGLVEGRTADSQGPWVAGHLVVPSDLEVRAVVVTYARMIAMFGGCLPTRSWSGLGGVGLAHVVPRSLICCMPAELLGLLDVVHA